MYFSLQTQLASLKQSQQNHSRFFKYMQAVKKDNNMLTKLRSKRYVSLQNSFVSPTKNVSIFKIDRVKVFVRPGVKKEKAKKSINIPKPLKIYKKPFTTIISDLKPVLKRSTEMRLITPGTNKRNVAKSSQTINFVREKEYREEKKKVIYEQYAKESGWIGIKQLGLS